MAHSPTRDCFTKTSKPQTTGRTGCVVGKKEIDPTLTFGLNQLHLMGAVRVELGGT
jgi:hypothetical protein